MPALTGIPFFPDDRAIPEANHMHPERTVCQSISIILTFTLHQRFLNIAQQALCNHGMSLHKLPDDLPSLRACMDVYGKTAPLSPAVP
jgi:hypothetical protein